MLRIGSPASRKAVASGRSYAGPNTVQGQDFEDFSSGI